MMGSRAIACCGLSFLLLPIVCCPQAPSRFANSAASESADFGGTVSVRELSIPDKARRAFQKGAERIAAKDWAGSISEFEKAIKAFGDLYEAYYKIGIARLELQQSEAAEAAFRKAIELSEGNYAPPFFALGLVLSNAGQHQDAEAAARAGLQLAPMDAAGHFTMAWVLYTAQRTSEAEESAREAVRRSPNFAMAHLLLAQIHRQQNKLAAMVEDLNTFLRLDPDGPRSSGARVALEKAERTLEQMRTEDQSASDNAGCARATC
jgi:tetratricopeptide (TPR) repeat protein